MKDPAPIPIVDHRWQNGQHIEVVYHPVALPDEADCDRIHLLITDCDGVCRGWIMNVEDAAAIIYGLSKAMVMAINEGVPVNE